MTGILMFVCGLLVGLIGVGVVVFGNTVGTLFFYHAEPNEPPVMTAELNREVEDVCKCNYVIFKVSRR